MADHIHSTGIDEFWGIYADTENNLCESSDIQGNLDVSAMSYGMYLMHMLILPYVFGICNPVMSPPLAIFATAIITYVVCYIIAKLISLFKFGKYIVG